jgi:hypothetical protein
MSMNKLDTVFFSHSQAEIAADFGLQGGSRGASLRRTASRKMGRDSACPKGKKIAI